MLLNKPSKLLTCHQLQYTECYKKGLEALRGYSTKSQLLHIKKAVPAETLESFREIRVLRTVEEDPGTSVRRIGVAEGIPCLDNSP